MPRPAVVRASLRRQADGSRAGACTARRLAAPRLAAAALLLALCTGSVSAKPMSGESNIQLVKGCSPKGALLSCRSCKAANTSDSVLTWPGDDGSARQRWQLKRVDGKSGSLLGAAFIIQSVERSGCKKYVAVAPGCGDAPVIFVNSASPLTTRWLIEEDSKGSATGYRIYAKGRASCARRYLGVPTKCPTGPPQVAGMYNRWDGSGNFRFNIVPAVARPPPPPTPSPPPPPPPRCTQPFLEAGAEGTTATAVCTSVPGQEGLATIGAIIKPVYGNLGVGCNATSSYKVVYDACIGRKQCGVNVSSTLFGNTWNKNADKCANITTGLVFSYTCCVPQCPKGKFGDGCWEGPACCSNICTRNSPGLPGACTTCIPAFKYGCNSSNDCCKAGYKCSHRYCIPAK